ncbi:hypothetical protein DFJ73DRAFT_903246 [Zopfochytrium polystomum]|nr:hypothetical protein DFJ73DRAFT_903246 [Zopfochytrium polystomum]
MPEGLLGAATAAVVAYLLLVRILRHRRINDLIAQHGQHPLSLTPEAARSIFVASTTLEFPFMSKIAPGLSLFRSFALPTVSKLLVATRQICNPAASSKRFVDTVLAVHAWTVEPADSLHANTIIARVNWLHEHYKKHIDRDSMAYVLSAFVVGPARYVDAYEWRRTTPLENAAAAAVWHEVGLKMGIARTPRTFDEFVAEFDGIEARMMQFHPDNTAVAEAGLQSLMAAYPSALRPVMRAVLLSFIDEKMVRALGLTPPPKLVAVVVRGLLYARALFVRHLMLPRSRPVFIAEAVGDRLFMKDEPTAIYVKPTFWNRWGLSAWLVRWGGRPVPGDKGTYPEGCDPRTIGPVSFIGQGDADVRERAEELMRGIYRANVWV